MKTLIACALLVSLAPALVGENAEQQMIPAGVTYAND